MTFAGKVWLVTMAFLGSAAAVLVWLSVPLLICHVPPTKDQAELGVLELNVSWNRSDALVMLIVSLAVAVSVAVMDWVPGVENVTEKVWVPASAVVKV